LWKESTERLRTVTNRSGTKIRGEDSVRNRYEGLNAFREEFMHASKPEM